MLPEGVRKNIDALYTNVCRLETIANQADDKFKHQVKTIADIAFGCIGQCGVDMQVLDEIREKLQADLNSLTAVNEALVTELKIARRY